LIKTINAFTLVTDRNANDIELEIVYKW